MDSLTVRWSELRPDAAIVEALNLAGARAESADQDVKRHWSETFANGCAVAIASQLRGNALKGKKILPQDVKTGTEPLTPLGAGTSKRIDVTVVDPVLGLELGVSLKGLNFRDAKSGNFDKNLTGRLYELADEMRLVHEHLPHAFMIGVFFLPIDSTEDKTVRGNSSFANTVVKLRERTGRLDVALAGHAPRCDMGFVCLYTTGLEVQKYPAGIARFFNVAGRPPRRGRPTVNQTLSLAEFAERVVAAATRESLTEWSAPEEDLA